jgi:hypothetical protein
VYVNLSPIGYFNVVCVTKFGEMVSVLHIFLIWFCAAFLVEPILYFGRRNKMQVYMMN